MDAKFIQDDETIDYTPSANVAAGEVVVIGELVAIAPRPIPANTLGSLATEGIFDIAKAAGAGSAISAGTKAYRDAANKVATATASGNTYTGKTTVDATDDDVTVRVRLQQ